MYFFEALWCIQYIFCTEVVGNVQIKLSQLSDSHGHDGCNQIRDHEMSASPGRRSMN